MSMCVCTIFKNFSDPFILFQEHRPSHLIKKNFIQTRNRKNKKVQGGCDEEQNVGDVDLNNVLDKDIWQKSFHVTPPDQLDEKENFFILVLSLSLLT